MSRIQKRDGTLVPFDQNKITQAIWKSAQNVGGTDFKLAEKISHQVCTVLEVFFKDPQLAPTVEQVQDLVEKILIENGHAKTAKAYILYREERNRLRQKKSDILGSNVETRFSLNTLKIFQQYYLAHNGQNQTLETPEQMFQRVAHTIAQADKIYNDFEALESEKNFYETMKNLDFLPNSAVLTNAGTQEKQFFHHIRLQLADDLENIFALLKEATLAYQKGSKVSIDVSALRPKGDKIASSQGSASGPLAFVSIFDQALHALKQGRRKPSLNYALIRIDHPDILDFIIPREEEKFENFHIVLQLTKGFVQAMENNEEYELINPRTGETVNRLHARNVFDIIAGTAWKKNNIHILFPSEQESNEYEAVVAGVLNLPRFVADQSVDWERLESVISTAVHFLDNTLELSSYPLASLEQQAKSYRDIELGCIGFSEMLILLGIPYKSSEALELADKLMSFLQQKAREASQQLALKRGNFHTFDQSQQAYIGLKALRNRKIVKIWNAPTLSRIAEVSQGVQPLADLVQVKKDMEGEEIFQIHPLLERFLAERKLLHRETLHQIHTQRSLNKLKKLDRSFERLYQTRDGLDPEYQIQLQSVFQKYSDGPGEVTIFCPALATIEAVKDIYYQSSLAGCCHVVVERLENLEKISPEALLTSLENQEDYQISLPLYNDKKPSLKRSKGFLSTSISSSSSLKKAQEVLPPPIEILS